MMDNVGYKYTLITRDTYFLLTATSNVVGIAIRYVLYGPGIESP
jgi:hypothetical protein